MVASKNNAREVVSVLLEAKADPNITNEVKLHYSHCLFNSNLMHCYSMVTLLFLGLPPKIL